MKNILFIFASLLSAYASAQTYELPVQASREQLVKHTLFRLSYSEGYELPSWAAWQLTPDQARATGTFREKYDEDPMVATGTSSTKDYRDAGFIMAQLVPVEDMFISPQAVTESFLMSNIVPQKPAFNKYIWKTNAKLIREWAKEGNTLYIVSGPVLADAPFGSFGPNRSAYRPVIIRPCLMLTEKGRSGFFSATTWRAERPNHSPFPWMISKKLQGWIFFLPCPITWNRK